MNWINKNWAKAGGISGVIILLILMFTHLNKSEWEFLLWIQLSVLLFHQFEEYVYPGGFKAFFNNNILNKNRITIFPLNDSAILIVNILIGWTAYTFCAVLNLKFIWFAAGLVLILISNGILHTAVAMFTKKYNPGLITGLFLLIPFGIFVLFKLEKILTLTDWIFGIIVFVIGSVSIPLTIYMSDKFKTQIKVKQI